ncbi:tlde1 domain-containing protein [Hansschlegelia sp.]|uniref:tlde1 domain-containing protein n=1 Tax=Hansschlegelia sp. TaxID=2041892 RepID=UPI002B8CFA9A|nr:tlde1 domain-containing protein [Hansschlegelia sp.]HVI29107.1 tlde1 domain-containing protein [Hansschlegelia sp.]
MSSSVPIADVARTTRLVAVGAALTLASAGSAVALLAIASTATANLMVAAVHRPAALEVWAPPAALQAHSQASKAVSIFAEHDARFGPAGADFSRDLSMLGAKLVEARLMLDGEPSATRGVPLQPVASEAGDDATLLASAPIAAEPASASLTPPPPTELAMRPAPRVISADAAVALASAVPSAPVIRLASLEAPPSRSEPAESAPAPLPESAVSSVSDPTPEPLPVPPLPMVRPTDVLRAAPADSAPPRPAVSSARPGSFAPGAPTPRPRTALAYAAPELESRSDAPNDFFSNLLGRSETARLPGRGSGIAVYDIASATVRLPSGEKLEAHSGLGHRQDNPVYVREKNRGPTPPNIYDLRMREARFHGAEAIRLLPRDQRKVFNRDGLLAHPYMYVGGGDRSQSNGCVVFKNYGRFLRAFKAGEIRKLVVVSSMAELPTYMSAL